MNERAEQIADELDRLADELAEMAIADLTNTVRTGGQRSSPEERRLTQARRALAKAATLLRTPDE
ncbi:MAG TPA: hypothetical protein PLV68_18985 [Ilumatobacteraceae bacterium]|nr:hypothetical protein [Ilumatobacteraceae bacterium]